jgi:hypothetical protein
MLKRCIAAILGEVAKRANENVLADVVDLMMIAGKACRGRENASSFPARVAVTSVSSGGAAGAGSGI